MQYEHIKNALYLSKVTKAALIDVHGELNENITSLDVEVMLNLISENIKPVLGELCELCVNPEYLYWKDKVIQRGIK